MRVAEILVLYEPYLLVPRKRDGTNAKALFKARNLSPLVTFRPFPTVDASDFSVGEYIRCSLLFVHHARPMRGGGGG